MSNPVINLVNTIIKQVWEEFPVAINFIGDMVDGESIVAGSSVAEANGATEADPIIKTDSLTVVDGTKLQVTVYGGAIGGRYNINMRAYISDDKKLEDDIILIVK